MKGSFLLVKCSVGVAIMRCVALKVRCVMNNRTNAKAWIFYLSDGKRAYLSENKLHAMIDDYAIHSLMQMNSRENRTFYDTVEVYCVKGRTQLLVHRFIDSTGIRGLKTQKGLI